MSKAVVLLLLLLFFQYPVYALDSTPSADIKTKLEELKQEIASKAYKLKQEVDRKLQNRAYVGKVKTKSQNTLTISSKNGSKIININEDTEFVSEIKGKKFSQKTIAEEDYLASLGDIDENGVLTAKRIILLSPSPSGARSEEKTYLWGQIISLSDKLATLKDKDSKNTAVSIPAPFKVRLNEFVILTGILGKNNIFEAEFVYVSQGGILKPKKFATPSSQMSTKSAKP